MGYFAVSFFFTNKINPGRVLVKVVDWVMNFGKSINSFVSYLKDIKPELKNIKRPSKAEIYGRSVGVFIISGICSLFFLLTDFITHGVLSFITGV